MKYVSTYVIIFLYFLIPAPSNNTVLPSLLLQTSPLLPTSPPPCSNHTLTPSPLLTSHLTPQNQIGKYHAIFERTEIIGDDPVLTDLLRDDFFPVYKRGKLINKYTDLKLTQVRERNRKREKETHEYLYIT